MQASTLWCRCRSHTPSTQCSGPGSISLHLYHPRCLPLRSRLRQWCGPPSRSDRSDLAQQQAGWKPGGSWERQQSLGQSVYSGISDAPWAIHTYQTHLTPGEGYAGQHHPYTQPTGTHLISTASGTSATPPYTTVGLPRYSSWTSHNAVRFHTPLAPFPSARGRTPWHVALSGAPLQSARTRAPLPPAPLRSRPTSCRHRPLVPTGAVPPRLLNYSPRVHLTSRYSRTPNTPRCIC